MSIALGILLGRVGSHFDATILAAKTFVVMATTVNMFVPSLTQVYKLR